MLKISRLADYSLIILNDLTAEPRRSWSASAISARTHIALPTVSKVLKLLNEGEIINSSRGPSGGYCLVKNPEEINLAEIIAAVDGVPALTECCQIENGCIRDARCALRSNWQFINRVIIKVLRQFTLADLTQPLSLQEINGDRHV